MSLRIPRSLALLGDVVDLRIEHDGKRFVFRPGKYHLCADTTKRVLWLIPKPEKKKRVPLEGQQEAAKVFRSWSQFVASEAFSAPVKTGPVKKAGTVNSLAYRSDKWSGKKVTYEHDFRAPPTLEKSGSLYRIRGGRIRVTPAGITG